MPYYLCPKCGSKDSYEATEIVSEHKKGRSTTIIGPENDLGFQPSFTSHQDGETTHRELTVSKCRQCDCLLGSKDLRHTEEEIRLKRQEAEKVKKDEDDFYTKLYAILWVLVGIAFLIAIIYANFVSRNGF